jgi:leucyl aminopeptidase (aminopeptidase T)
VHNPENVPTKLDKFAELIVRKCISKIENEAEQYAAPVWAVELVNDIKETFGVDE